MTETKLLKCDTTTLKIRNVISELTHLKQRIRHIVHKNTEQKTIETIKILERQLQDLVQELADEFQ